MIHLLMPFKIKKKMHILRVVCHFNVYTQLMYVYAVLQQSYSDQGNNSVISFAACIIHIAKFPWTPAVSKFA